MLADVVWAINYKSDFRFDLQGCFEAILASEARQWAQNIEALCILDMKVIEVTDFKPEVRFDIGLKRPQELPTRGKLLKDLRRMMNLMIWITIIWL